MLSPSLFCHKNVQRGGLSMKSSGFEDFVLKQNANAAGPTAWVRTPSKGNIPCQILAKAVHTPASKSSAMYFFQYEEEILVLI